MEKYKGFYLGHTDIIRLLSSLASLLLVWRAQNIVKQIPDVQEVFFEQ